MFVFRTNIRFPLMEQLLNILVGIFWEAISRLNLAREAQFLNEYFPGRIGLMEWPARSPDLAPMHFSVKILKNKNLFDIGDLVRRFVSAYNTRMQTNNIRSTSEYLTFWTGPLLLYGGGNFSKTTKLKSLKRKLNALWNDRIFFFRCWGWVRPQIIMIIPKI